MESGGASGGVARVCVPDFAQQWGEVKHTCVAPTWMPKRTDATPCSHVMVYASVGSASAAAHAGNPSHAAATPTTSAQGASGSTRRPYATQ